MPNSVRFEGELCISDCRQSQRWKRINRDFTDVTMPRILIVDDSPTEVVKLTQLLTKHGYDVLTAENGERGIAMVRKETPDVVLMDVVMPGINGFQATRQLSRDPDTMNIPIIIVTTKNQETDRLWGERQGAKGYLTKPVDGKLLISTIRELMPSH